MMAFIAAKMRKNHTGGGVLLVLGKAPQVFDGESQSDLLFRPLGCALKKTSAASSACPGPFLGGASFVGESAI